MSLTTEDKKEISTMIKQHVNKALDFVDDDQAHQDNWMRSQISKINSKISKINQAISTINKTILVLQTNSRWHTVLLVAILASILSVIIGLAINLMVN